MKISFPGSTIQRSRRLPLVEMTDQGSQAPARLVSNGRRDFRALQCPLQVIADEGVRLSRDAALALEMRIGDMVTFVTLG